jgi:hypothetical protein
MKGSDMREQSIRAASWLAPAAALSAVAASSFLAGIRVGSQRSEVPMAASTPSDGPGASGFVFSPILLAGSVGVVDESDVADVVFAGARAKILNSATNSTSVLRYPIQPYFHGGEADLQSLQLYIRYRDNGPDARIVARLKSFDAFNGGTTTLLIFDSDDFPQMDQMQSESVADSSGDTDYVYGSIWFVEVTITRGATAGRPELEAVQVWMVTP